MDKLLSPYFLISLLLLILNDYLFKWTFSNWWTGKLSDLTGLVVLSYFLLVLFPRLKASAVIPAGLFLIYWKSPLSTPFIDWINQISLLSIARVPDYSDLITLTILPGLFFVLKADKQPEKNPKSKVFLGLVSFLITILALTGTSVVRHIIPQGDVFIGEWYDVKGNEQAILDRIQEMGYLPSIDSTANDSIWGYSISYYTIEDFILNEQDTLQSIQFRLIPNKSKSTRLNILNISFYNYDPIADWRTLRELQKRYRKQLKRQFIVKINQFNSNN